MCVSLIGGEHSLEFHIQFNELFKNDALKPLKDQLGHNHQEESFMD